jgi:hypothetical protein
MTQRELKEAIRATRCRVRYSAAEREWRVTAPDGGVYFTDAADDALATARAMAQRAAGL